jgi:L-ascorbate metabolism protein UlaG (beta-lactamase superfamily)
MINSVAVSGSTAWTQSGNNKHMLELQDASTVSKPGSVIIDYFGHCAFRITSPAGLTMMFDPWRNDPSGAFGFWFAREFPREVVDICASTHAHFDHDAIYHVDASSILDRMIGTWSFADVTITGIADKHALSEASSFDLAQVVRDFGADPFPPNNPGNLDMVTYLIDTGGMRILMWGDNRHNPSEGIWSHWGHVDVLTLPVDASYRILDYDQANAIVDRLKPKVIIPTHYLMKGTSLAVSALRTADGWVDSQKNKCRLDSSRLILHPSDIASMDREFFYFGNNACFGQQVEEGE